MCELNKDTLIEILSRLPVKSLVRFMSVCRLWKSIITSPQSKLLSNRPIRLLVHTNRKCYTVVEDEEEEKKGGVVFEADFPLKHLHTYEKAVIVGNDNGLICIRIHSSSSFIVWNPSIRKHVVFPDQRYGANFIVYSTGFGATNTGLDYKLVRLVGIVVTADENGWTDEKSFHIYSLKAGTWRRFDLDYNLYSKRLFSFSPAVLRGRLHWLVSESRSFFNCISTLELEDEVFENNAMMLPEHLSTNGLDCLNNQHVITVIRGESLALIAKESAERNCTSLRVMQEYGDGGSWVKWCSIHDDHTIENFNLNHIRMVGVLKNGNLLLTILYCPYKFVTWDPKTTKTNDFGGVLLSPLGVCGSSYYKESLALLADEDRAVSDHRIFV